MAFNPIQFPIANPTIVHSNVIQQPSNNQTNIWDQAVAGIGAGVGKGLGGMISEFINPDPNRTLIEQQAKNQEETRMKPIMEEMGYLREAAKQGDTQAAAKYQALQQKYSGELGESADALAYSPEQSKKAQYMSMQEQEMGLSPGGSPPPPPTADATPEEYAKWQATKMKIGNMATMLQDWKLGQRPTPDQMMLGNASMKEAVDLHSSMMFSKTKGQDTNSLAAVTDMDLITKLMQAKEKIASMDPAVKQQGYTDIQGIMEGAKKMYSPQALMFAMQSADDHLTTGLSNASKIAQIPIQQETAKTMAQARQQGAETFDHTKGLWKYDEQFKVAQLEQMVTQNTALGLNVEQLRRMNPIQAEQAKYLMDAMRMDNFYKPQEKNAALAAAYASLKYQKTQSMMAMEQFARTVAKDELGMQGTEANEALKKMMASAQMLNSLANFKAKSADAALVAQQTANRPGATEQEKKVAAEAAASAEALVGTVQAGLINLVQIPSSSGDPNKFQKLYQRVRESMGIEGGFLDAYDPSTGQVNPEGLKIGGTYSDALLREAASHAIQQYPGMKAEDLLKQKVNGTPVLQYLMSKGYTKNQVMGVFGVGTGATATP